MRIQVVIGTRPEAIKMAPVVKALRAIGPRAGIATRLVSTGQHGSLLTEALAAFDVSLDADMGLMRPGQSPTALAGRMLLALDAGLATDRPDMLVVHGDTTTGFAAGLAGFYSGIPVVHVEAGLRSFRLDSPFPEEFHRQAIARLASLHFAPSAEAVNNLLAEGVPADAIVLTGSTALDAAREIMRGATARPAGGTVIVTAHRRENRPAMPGLMQAVGRLAARHPERRFLLPMHPAVRDAAMYLPSLPNLEVVGPMPYREFLPELAACDLVVTDSGGIQEEAAYLGRPALLLRDATERPESVEAGLARLVGTSAHAIIAAAEQFLANPPAAIALPVGGGAARRIARTLAERGRMLVAPGAPVLLSAARLVG